MNFREFFIVFNNSISLSPNPNNGNFDVSFELKNTGDIQLEVLNLIGQNVNQMAIKGISGKIKQNVDCKNLSKGVYLLNITYEGKRYTRRFIKD